MTKRTIFWAGAVGLFLVAGLCAAKLGRKIVRAELRRSVQTAAAYEMAAVPQKIEPRAAEFLQPQRPDSWQIIGPGGGGTFYHVTVSPHDPNLVFATTDMTACYASENGGRSWRTFNLRWGCGRFIFDPKLPNRVYTIAGTLWRSEDRGHTWGMVDPDPTTHVYYLDDEAEPSFYSATGYIKFQMWSMAIDPEDSNTLYASMSDEALQVSHDAGKSWKVLAPGVIAQELWIDPTSPRDKRVLYTRRANTIGTWDGSKFTTHPVPGGDVFGSDFGMAGGHPVLYIASDFALKDGLALGGISATEDGGKSWRSLNDGLLKLVAKNTYPNFSTMAVSHKNANVIYASFTHYTSAIDNKPYYGVLKTSDGGATWATVRQENSTTAPNMHNDWTSSRWGPDFGDEPLSIGVSENDPNIVYTTDLARMMRSTDGGTNWYGVNSQNTGSGVTTTGLDVTTCYGIHFDPFDPKRVFITYTDIGLMRSEDGGESWMSATTSGVPKDWQNTTYWLEFDPAVKGKMWAVMSRHHDLPRYRELNRGGPGGVVMSTDGGKTWTVTSRGLSSTTQPTHILLDPKSPPEARVLYIAAFGQGVFKSTDGGQNWVLKNAGLPQDKPPLAWRLSMDSEGTLYVVTIRRSQDGKYGNADDGFVFRSRNGGDSWERVTLPEGVNGPVAVTPDPRDPARLYLAAWARYTLYATGAVPPAGGVYISTDGGKHWQAASMGLQRAYDVTLDPRNPDIVYATGFDASAWRSADKGKTWARLGGFNFKDGHRVIPDPVDSSKIYITTFGNSVWHGPATGDPQAVEDIVGAPATVKFQTAWKK